MTNIRFSWITLYLKKVLDIIIQEKKIQKMNEKRTIALDIKTLMIDGLLCYVNQIFKELQTNGLQMIVWNF